jgi:ABC-type multidrug transport system fused ATPase/permease subunit
MKAGPIGTGFSLSIPQFFGVAVVVTLARIAFQVVEARAEARITADALFEMRTILFNDFVDTSWSVQSLEREGYLQELMSRHIPRVALSLLQITFGINAAFSILTLLGSAVALNAISAITIVGAVVMLTVVFRPLIARSRAQSLIDMSGNNSFAHTVNETVFLAQEIKVFGASEGITNRAAQSVRESADGYFKNRYIARLLPSLYQSAAILIVLLGLATAALVGTSHVVEIGGVILILVRALAYAQQLMGYYQAASDAMPHVDEICSQFLRYQEGMVPGGSLPLASVHSLKFADVSFSYNERESVLNGIEFEIERGQVIGVIGPSGAGKSTLVQILLGLRAPTQGRYLINGEDAGEYSRSDLSRRICFVPQESRLLSASVAENIRFFRPALGDEAILNAARMARLYDEVAAWPEGFQTPVGERGSAMSGGQRQRLSLARALVGMPDVLVLDEPTSALDMRSEALVQETLHALKGSVTMIIVAHRLSTLNICDKIMVFDSGRLAHFDERSVLLASSDFYRDAVELSELRS